MNIFELYSNAIKPEHIEYPKQTEMQTCCFTGKECLCIPLKECVSNGFVNTDILLAPNSKYASIEVFQAFKHHWERSSSWLITDKEFIRLKTKLEIRPLVLNGVESNLWAGYITTSYKKHGTLKTVINSGNKAFWGFENLLVDCSDKKKVNEWFQIMLTALKNGIYRTSIETCDCQSAIIGKVGIKTWLDFYKWGKDKYQSPLYQFLCYLLPSKEELKNNEI